MSHDLEYYCDKPFPELVNDCFLKAAKGEPVEQVPVWIMRQAGRYLPEFRELRSKHSFFEICQTPRLACEVTLQPIKRYPLDAAIIFSDILVVPQALGMEVLMTPGPNFPNPLTTPEDLKSLNFDCDVYDKLSYVFQAIKLTRHELEGRVPLIGFTGGPWTLMCYMIEGSSSLTMAKAKRWLYEHEVESEYLLKNLSRVIINYLVAQIEWGAQAVQVFESHAGVLGPDQFNKLLLPYLKQICKEVKTVLREKKIAPVPMIIFCKGAFYAIEDLANTDYDVISLDWTIPADKARTKIPNKTLQGNLDPCALYAHPDSICCAVQKMITALGPQHYIANLGHGIYPDISPEHVSTFINSVHEFSRELISRNKLAE